MMIYSDIYYWADPDPSIYRLPSGRTLPIRTRSAPAPCLARPAPTMAAPVRRASTVSAAPMRPRPAVPVVRTCAPCLGLPPARGEFRCGPCAARIGALVGLKRQGLRVVV
jgi:hypothetical protein